jgi:hypothetical protein
MADAGADLDLTLERLISAPLTARAAVQSLLPGPTDDAFSQLALLATSEVVTHALTRGAGSCQLRAWHVQASGWLRVEVTDHGGGPLPPISTDPHAPDPMIDDVGSLRLAVLLEVASAWGVDQSPFGRTTWFEIAR